MKDEPNPDDHGQDGPSPSRLLLAEPVRVSGQTRRPRLLLLVAVVGLAIVIYVCAHPSVWTWSPPTLQSPTISLPPPLLPSPPAGLDQVSLPADSSSPIPGWVARLIGLLLLAALAVVIVIFLYRLIRALVRTKIQQKPATDHLGQGPTVKDRQLSPPELTDAVGEALRRLDQAATATDAVIQAWLSFEEAAERHGVARDPAETPTEFTADLIERSQVPVNDVELLKKLYLRARFSDLATKATDVAQARACLEDIARALEGPAEQTDGSPAETGPNS